MAGAGGYAWPPCIEYALSSLNIDPLEVEAHIAAFVRRWGGLDQPALACAVREGAGDDRLFALIALEYEPTPKFHTLLLPLLDSSAPLERWVSAVYLARLGEQQAAPVLRTMLVDFLPTQLNEYFENGLSTYDEWRSAGPTLLAKLGDYEAIPSLRQALERLIALLGQGTTFPEAEIVTLSQLPSQRHDLSTVDRERIRAALNPGRRKYLGSDGKPVLPKDATGWIETSHGNPGMLQLLLSDVDNIVYTLGRMGAFGALTGIAVPELYQRLWMVHLVMGHLHNHFSAPGSEINAAWRHDTLESVLAPLVGPVLQQRFGLDEQEQAQSILLWVLAKATATLDILKPKEREHQEHTGK